MAEYKKVQFLGYAIHTNPRVDYSGAGVDKWWFMEKTYLGLDKESDDLAARLKIMRAAMDKAYNESDKAADTLKIFVAPEFFFRGRHGAYEFAGMDAAIAGLQELAKPSKWNGWLFFFGSILGWYEDQGGKTTILNLCVVQPGGKGPEASRIVRKEHKSHIDFAKRFIQLVHESGYSESTNMPNAPGHHDESVQHEAAGASGKGKEWSKHASDGLGMFVQDGITYGVEVCLDHDKQRLKKSPAGTGRTLPQLHIVTSAGMELDPKAIVALKDGWAFNVDGSYPLPGKGANKAHSQLKKVTSPAGAGPAVLAADSAYKAVALPGDPNHAKLFAGGPGELHVYTPVDVPKAQISVAR